MIQHKDASRLLVFSVLTGGESGVWPDHKIEINPVINIIEELKIISINLFLIKFGFTVALRRNSLVHLTSKLGSERFH